MVGTALSTRGANHEPACRCLTPRSSGAPTAGHQARSGGTRYIFASPGLASCRRRPLSSNVRHQKGNRFSCQQEVRLSAWIEQPRGGKAANSLISVRAGVSAGQSEYTMTPPESANRVQQRVYGRSQRSDGWRTHQLGSGVPGACEESTPRAWACGQHCKALSALQGSWHAPQTRSTATAPAVARRGKQNPWQPKSSQPVGHRAH